MPEKVNLKYLNIDSVTNYKQTVADSRIKKGNIGIFPDI
jgi:hypothetical protein